MVRYGLSNIISELLTKIQVSMVSNLVTPSSMGIE